MIADRPRPLPECVLCGTPTRRRAHRVNRGMCTACRRVYDASRPEQQLLLDFQASDRGPDLSNVVVLDTRRPHPDGRR